MYIWSCFHIWAQLLIWRCLLIWGYLHIQISYLKLSSYLDYPHIWGYLHICGHLYVWSCLNFWGCLHICNNLHICVHTRSFEVVCILGVRGGGGGGLEIFFAIPLDVSLANFDLSPFKDAFSNGPDGVGRWQRATFFFFFHFYSGDLYWIGSDESCSTLIGQHKLGAVDMHQAWFLSLVLYNLLMHWKHFRGGDKAPIRTTQWLVLLMIITATGSN